MAGISDKDLKALADSIEYKPEYTLHRDLVDRRRFWWEHKGDDNFGKYERGALTVQFDKFRIGEDATEAEAVAMFFAYLAYIEDHDMRERFKVRGKRVYNPHRNGAEVVIKHLLPGDRDFHIQYHGDSLRY